MIERRTPLKRSRLKPRATPVRKRRPGGPRRGPPGIPSEEWRNPEYLRFLRREGRCWPCRSFQDTGDTKAGFLEGFCEPMHGPVNGKSSKGPDAGAMPGCRRHHDEQHAIGWPAFERKYRIGWGACDERAAFTREGEAARWWRRFLDEERR